jgi:penicillin-binding protein 1A
MQLHAEEAVSAHMANLQEEFFNQSKDNKTLLCQHFSVETQNLNQAMKSSNRWAVMKSLDKKMKKL